MGKHGISYIRVPVHLLRLGLRSAHELALLGLAVGFNGKGVRMSNAELAQLLQMDRRHVPRLIGRLVDREYLRVEDQNGRRIVQPTDTILVPPPDTKVVTPRHQSGDKVTPEVPPPSISEGTEIELKGAPSASGSRSPKAKRLTPPTVDEVRAYATEKGRPDFDAQRFTDYYEAADWHDSKGNPVRNWKQKMLAVWLRPDNGDGKTKPQDADFAPFGTHRATEEEIRSLEEAGVL
jgi:hypothetical protein